MGFFVLAFMKDKYRNRLDAEQSRRYGKGGGRAPLTAACAPHFGTQNTVIGTSRND